MVLCVATWFVHGASLESRESFPDELDVLYVPPARHLEVMSLGYKEALADLIWVRALVFSGARIEETDVAAVTRYVNAITGLAPRFHRPYLWGGVTTIYGGGANVEREMVDRSIVIYRRGIEQFPESHELLYPLGMVLTHQVASTPGYTEQEREALAREGVELIRRAAAFGADPLVRQYAATIITDYASEQLAVQFYESQLASAQNEGYRRLLRKRLEELKGGESIQRIEAVRTEFSEEHREQAAYLPDTLYAVIRE